MQLLRTAKIQMKLQIVPVAGWAFGPRAGAATKKKKSKFVAVVLAAIFGPLGMLYLGVEGLGVILFVVGISFFLAPFFFASMKFPALRLAIFLLVRIACIIWAIKEPQIL